MIVFDPAKDRSNIAKHGISLARAADMEIVAFVEDDRFDEPRLRLYGWIDGETYCLAAAERGGLIRAISLRRAHSKEVKRHDELYRRS